MTIIYIESPKTVNKMYEVQFFILTTLETVETLFNA